MNERENMQKRRTMKISLNNCQNSNLIMKKMESQTEKRSMHNRRGGRFLRSRHPSSRILDTVSTRATIRWQQIATALVLRKVNKAADFHQWCNYITMAMEYCKASSQTSTELANWCSHWKSLRNSFLKQKRRNLNGGIQCCTHCIKLVKKRTNEPRVIDVLRLRVWQRMRRDSAIGSESLRDRLEKRSHF